MIIPKYLYSICFGGMAVLAYGCSDKPATPDTAAADPLVEYVAIIEGSAGYEADYTFESTSKYDQTLNARFYRLDTPIDPDALITLSGVNDRGCISLPGPIAPPWNIYPKELGVEASLVDVGEVLTVISETGSWGELSQSDSTEHQYSVNVQVDSTAEPTQLTIDIPGAEFPAITSFSLPMRSAMGFTQVALRDTNLPANPGPDRYDQWRPSHRFFLNNIEESKADTSLRSFYFEKRREHGYQTQFTELAALCKGDYVTPLQFSEAEIGDAAGNYFQMYSSYSGTNIEIRDNVLILSAFTIRSRASNPGSAPAGT